LLAKMKNKARSETQRRKEHSESLIQYALRLCIWQATG
jgi:hypothetical protein